MVERTDNLVLTELRELNSLIQLIIVSIRSTHRRTCCRKGIRSSLQRSLVSQILYKLANNIHTHKISSSKYSAGHCKGQTHEWHTVRMYCWFRTATFQGWGCRIHWAVRNLQVPDMLLLVIEVRKFFHHLEFSFSCRWLRLQTSTSRSHGAV